MRGRLPAKSKAKHPSRSIFYSTRPLVKYFSLKVPPSRHDFLPQTPVWVARSGGGRALLGQDAGNCRVRQAGLNRIIHRAILTRSASEGSVTSCPRSRFGLV